MVKTFYWNKKVNFGDLLTYPLLKRFAGLESTWAPPVDADLVVVGSILDLLPRQWNGVIAGAGKLHQKTVLDFPDAKILAVRGPLTAKGLKGDFVMADPALLADELVPLPDRIYNLGVIPHWTDTTLEFDKRFAIFDPKIIRVSDDPLKVISEIGQCKKIVSSSLHGIIIADAFGIPRRIEIAPRMLTHAHQEGGLFKWEDYSASLGMKFEVGLTQMPDRNKVTEMQHDLFDVFSELSQIYN